MRDNLLNGLNQLKVSNLMQKKFKTLLQNVGEEFKTQRLSLVTAESCTGGGIAFYISQQPGCSQILERAFVTYSLPAKHDLLGVHLDTLHTEGAVSKAVAIQMAEGALRNSKAQISVSTTGFSGEDSEESNDKGTIWFACAGINKKTVTIHKTIKGTREEFTLKIIEACLKFLLEYIQKK